MLCDLLVVVGCMISNSAPPSLSLFLVALDDKGDLTDPLGLRMAEFPLSPMFARMLLMSGQFSSQDFKTFIAHGNFAS